MFLQAIAQKHPLLQELVSGFHLFAPNLCCPVSFLAQSRRALLPSQALLSSSQPFPQRKAIRQMLPFNHCIALFWYLIFSLRPTIRGDEDCVRWRCVLVCVYVCDPLVGYGSSMQAKQSLLGANLCGIEQHPMQWVGSHGSNFSQLILSVKIHFSWIFYQTCVWETVGERKKLEMH